MGAAAASFRNAGELPALVSYVRDRRCVLFVGAGLSRPAGYPGWGELMRRLVEWTEMKVGAAADAPELTALIGQGKFAEVADQCRTLLGRARFGEHLRSILAAPAEPPEATHRAIVRTPYASIVTTNFDTLLEDAYARWSDIGIPKAPTGMELSQHGTLLLDDAFFILKAHGTIHDDESMVFTSEDYRRITHANPAFQAVMASLMLTRAVLFVGYSLSDPNFRLLMDSQLSTFGTDAPPRYALMENVGAAEKAILRRTTGIEVISFPKGEYGEVAHFLQYLADASRAGEAAVRGHKPLRDVRPLPARVLRLRPRDIWIESIDFATTTRDLSGSAVPLQETFAGTGARLDWNGLRETLGDAVLASPYGGERQKAWPACTAVGGMLAQAVPDFIGRLRGRPPGTPVVLDIAPDLWGLPWEWTTVAGKPLCLRHPVCRAAPSIRDASRGRPFVRSPLRALLIGDPQPRIALGMRLPGARQEVTTLARRIRAAQPRCTVTLLVGADASYARVLHEMRTGGYDVVHFSGASAVGDSGSWLALHDGEVGTAELVTLLIKRPPALLVLSALATNCVPAFSSYFPLNLPDGLSFDDHYRRMRSQRVGFERAAVRAGVGTVVGTMGNVMDESSSTLMLAFYDALLAGTSAIEALHQARPAALAKGKPTPEDSTALQVAMTGYADLRLVAPRGPRRDRQPEASP